MPKNPLKFGRRKSSPLIIDDPSTPTPAVSSFRVLERPEKINLNGDQRPATAVRPVTRPYDSPIPHLRALSTDRLDASPSRASAGTFRSGSSGIYESSSASARHSSTSTLPSSIDAEREQEDEELFQRKGRPVSTFHDVPLDDSNPVPQPLSFTDRASRALELVQNHSRTQSSPHFVPSLPSRPKNAARSPERHSSPLRERAMTTSSYASTARPDGYVEIASPDAGNGLSPVHRPRSGDRWDGPLPPLPPAAAYHRTDSPPIFHSRTQSQSPYRSSPDISKDDTDPPYAWNRRGSADRLMPESPSRSPDLGAPPPPPHRTSALFGQSSDGYAKVPDRYSSPVFERYPSPSLDGFVPDRGMKGEEFGGRHKHLDSADRFGRENLSNLPKPGETEDDESLFPDAGSRNATPRAARMAIGRQQNNASLDSSPLGPPSRALRPSSYRNTSYASKRMTKEQFERLQRRRDSNAEESEEDEVRSEGDENEEEDDAERAKRVAKQRQKQEANMSVYRQQMKKVTGGAPLAASPTIRPGFDRSPGSSPALMGSGASIHLGGIGGTPPPDASYGKQSDDDDEDDDVPLGILQAHGFPHSSRPASRADDKDGSIQRRPSPAGSTTGRGSSPGNLPPFARRLPADPYFGAGLVNPASRESLALTGTPSVYGGVAPSLAPAAPSMGQPGGLVGVIAGEERARASRRGSPNPITGTFGPAAVPMGMPPMVSAPGMPSRSVSMGSMMPAQPYLPSGMGPIPMIGMPQMPMMSDPLQQEQMQQFMQMQMQFMQNMMAMQPQTGPMSPILPQQSPDLLAVPTWHAKQRSISSSASHAPSVTRSGRAMSALSPPTNWNVPMNGQRHSSYAPSGLNIPLSGPAPGYTPSIAPTERSNIGMPSRYRPVHVSSDSSLRATSMASAQASNTASDSEKSQPKATIRAIDKAKGTPSIANKAPSTTSEEEDDGWADLKKKREDKKSKFRIGKKGREITMEELVHELR